MCNLLVSWSGRTATACQLARPSDLMASRTCTVPSLLQRPSNPAGCCLSGDQDPHSIQPLRLGGHGAHLPSRHGGSALRAQQQPGFTGSRSWDAYFVHPQEDTEPGPVTDASDSDAEDTPGPASVRRDSTATVRGQQGPILEADFEEVTPELVTSARPAKSGRAALTSDEQQQEADRLRLKSNILLDMVAAGDNIDKVIAENVYEIDDYLIGLLEKRIETAQGFDDDEVVEGLLLLWQRLRIERERFNATPAQRLLDDVLQIMDAASPAEYEDKLKDVRKLLKNAFTPLAMQELSPVNIFGVASVLGQGGELPPEDIVGEFVPQWQFLGEGQDLLQEVRDEQHKLEHALQSGMARGQEDDIREVIQERADVITQLQEVLAIANSIKPDLE